MNRLARLHALAILASTLAGACGGSGSVTDPTSAVGARPFPVGVAITSDGAFAYVTNRDSGTVSVIATATNTVVATVGVGTLPFGVAITPDGAFAYVTNEGSGTVL